MYVVHIIFPANYLVVLLPPSLNKTVYSDLNKHTEQILGFQEIIHLIII